MSETPFVETEALLAVMEGDEDKAIDILKSMYRNERIALARASDRLGVLTDEVSAGEDTNE